MTATGTGSIDIDIEAVVIAPTLPLWSPSPDIFRALGTRLVVLLLIGVGTATFARQLAHEQEQTGSHRAEAERLAELDRLRNEFVSIISHDLRTPLTAASAGLGMLETEDI
jgi:signal transduction histidine kinase